MLFKCKQQEVPSQDKLIEAIREGIYAAFTECGLSNAAHEVREFDDTEFESLIASYSVPGHDADIKRAYYEYLRFWGRHPQISKDDNLHDLIETANEMVVMGSVQDIEELWPDFVATVQGCRRKALHVDGRPDVDPSGRSPGQHEVHDPRLAEGRDVRGTACCLGGGKTDRRGSASRVVQGERARARYFRQQTVGRHGRDRQDARGKKSSVTRQNGRRSVLSSPAV